jgi:glutamate-1-semialdehyde aminotransferase
MNKGIFIPNRGFFSVSTPMSENEINQAVAAAEEVLSELKPLIQEIEPRLIG